VALSLNYRARRYEAGSNKSIKFAHKRRVLGRCAENAPRPLFQTLAKYNMTKKIALSQDELEAHLQEQLSFLESSAASFDSGFEGEAKRLAVTLRVLLHETKYSKSLLGQLGKLDQNYINTAFNYDPENQLSHSGLVFIAIGQGGTRYIAQLDDVPESNIKEISFDEWWNSPVFVDDKKRQLSRKELITIAANQDGGAHVDPGLDETYSDLSKNNSLGWNTENNGVKGILLDPEKAAIRQIAHEVLKTLKCGYAKKVKHEASMIVGGMSITQVPPPKHEKKKPIVRDKKIGRNEPCPCNSGKKYKHCHGRVTG